MYRVITAKEDLVEDAAIRGYFTARPGGRRRRDDMPLGCNERRLDGPVPLGVRGLCGGRRATLAAELSGSPRRPPYAGAGRDQPRPTLKVSFPDRGSAKLPAYQSHCGA
jgi:hypothetical protein